VLFRDADEASIVSFGGLEIAPVGFFLHHFSTGAYQLHVHIQLFHFGRISANFVWMILLRELAVRDVDGIICGLVVDTQGLERFLQSGCGRKIEIS
jgi:hypothetical protein